MTEEQIELARKKRNEYFRAYKAKNKAKIKEINARYWLKKAQEDKQD